MAQSEYLGVKVPVQNNFVEWARNAAAVINAIILGKTNNTGQFTCTANVASTTITISGGRITDNSTIHLMPTTANAQAATAWVSDVDAENNQFTVTHNNTATTDRIFKFTHHG
jgi:hypothetical protein